MNKIKVSILIFIWGFIASCQRNSEKIATIDSNIILINYKTVDRSAIAKTLEKIRFCEPKLVVINALFLEKSGTISDSLLSNAISLSKNVILVSNINSNELIRSNEIFTSQCIAEGFLEFRISNEIVKEYKPYKSIGEQVIWSLPITVVTYYDPLKGATMLRHYKTNEYYEIDFNRNNENYNIIDIDQIDNIDCDELHNRIILLGYLGPDEEDMITTPLNNKDGSRTYRTIVIANIISNLLEDTPGVQ